jgi:EpsD family peptidyl-prolyl cis-trans isomerase
MKTTALLLFPILALAISASAADSTVIAKIGSSEVRADDIKPFLEKLSVRDQLALSKNPAALNEYVRGLIVQQLVYKEALSKKWDQQPQVVAALDKMRQQTITQSYLQSVAAPAQDFPSASDLQAAYDQLKKANALQVPKQYHLAQIYIACPKGADKSVEEKAQSRVDAAAKALKSGDFSDVAKAQTDDPASGQRGGDLGFLPESQIQPEIRTAVASLSKNGTTDPIRMNDGWHIVRLTEVKDPYTASLDEVKISLTNELRNQKSQLLGKAYLAKLLQDNPVTLNEIAVSKLVDPKSN